MQGSDDSALGATSRQRGFTIQSEFGGARRWRSRKSRPCDACRKRKSACVIEHQPPCLFCKGRGLKCQAANRAPEAQRQNGQRQHIGDVDGLQSSPAPTTNIVQPTDGSAVRRPTSVSPATTGNSHRTLRTRSLVQTGTPCLEPSIPAQPEQAARTAHLMGLSAEQDTHLLASFRSFIMDELDQVSGEIVQVQSGNTALGKPPIHFCVLHDAFMPWDSQIRHEASDTIEAKVAPHGMDLVRLYFKHVHTVYCVVSKVRFLRAYKYDKLSIPASLRGVIYGLAAVFWNQDGYLSTIARPFEQYELFHAAQASLERELDAPNLWKLQACLLMLHEQPASNHTFQTPRTWTLSAQAVACAQMIGLHRDPTDWNIEPWEKSLRKKLWWATYLTDAWASVSHGNPPLIYNASFTTSMLDMADLRFDEDVPGDLQELVDHGSVAYDISTAARFLEHVSLTRILRDILDTSFTDQSYQVALFDAANHEACILQIQERLQSWSSMMPQCVTMTFINPSTVFKNNGPLHLAHFATQILLFRALMTPASMTAKRNPNSSLRRHFTRTVRHLDSLLDFMDHITISTLQSFWGRHARAQLMLIGNFLELLFLLSSGPGDVSSTYGLLERFHESLQRLTEVADEDIMTLIRPVAIRIDTFFTQAAQMMRESTADGSHLDSILLDITP